MKEKKKAGLGAILTILTILVLAVALVLYLQNCKTNYFMNMGVNRTVVLNLVIAIAAEVLFIGLSFLLGSKPYPDIFPVIAGVCSAVAAIQFIGSRIAGAASIMTFENNAENMADLQNAIVAMAVCVAAMLCVMVSGFFRVIKE
ncbi:hypothetical protein C823_003431 [Eubacterium plexicaudatum ASF492]|uniref:Uncharacterized protein n=1 Tax=Eubacterium plexicaudatum ASF492 TaxID=1235802 RepID=N2AN50_9FIRM|nr:hypothetical protein C823_003431 [Eubacterium plexicaudatum ASF492]